MEIKKIDERDLVVNQRNKRNQDKRKTIFEIRQGISALTKEE